MMVRLDPTSAEHLREAAHAARTRPAVLARIMIERALERGEVPPPAPPTVDRMTESARRLRPVLARALANLTQISGHAQRLGEPFGRLADSGGVLKKFSAAIEKIGLQIELGELDGARLDDILARLDAPLRTLNDQLARPLNEGQAVAGPTWKSILEAIGAALQDTKK